MNLTFAANLTKMIDAGLGREAAPPETFVAVGRTTEYTDLGPVPIASFETNVEAPLRALSVSMEPIQDLHGQDAPYPAGITANIIPDGTDTTNGYLSGYYLKADGTVSKNGSYYISEYFPVTAGATYTWSANFAALAPGICFYDINKNFISGFTANSALPKTFAAPADAVYARSTQGTLASERILQLEIGSEATTPMLYSNICPILGWTGANVHQFALPKGYTEVDYVTLSAPIAIDTVNDWNRNDIVIDVEFRLESYVQYGAVYTAYTSESANATRFICANASGSYYVNNNNIASRPITLTGFAQNNFHKAISTHEKLIIDGIEYPITQASGTTNTAQELRLTPTGSFSYKQLDVYTTSGTSLFSLIPCKNPNDVAGFYDVVSGRFFTTASATDITATDEAARKYYGISHIIDWTDEVGMVYGGNLDVTNGVLTVDRGYLTLDNTASWEMTTAGKFFVANVTSDPAEATTGYISNQYLFSGNGSTPSNYINIDKRFYGQRAYRRIWVYDSQYTTLEDFKAALSTTPLQIVYPLAQPQTIQLTPEQITTLIGANNVWSDGGDVSLTYGTVKYTEGY